MGCILLLSLIRVNSNNFLVPFLEVLETKIIPEHYYKIVGQMPFEITVNDLTIRR